MLQAKGYIECEMFNFEFELNHDEDFTCVMSEQLYVLSSDK